MLCCVVLSVLQKVSHCIFWWFIVDVLCWWRFIFCVCKPLIWRKLFVPSSDNFLCFFPSTFDLKAWSHYYRVGRQAFSGSCINHVRVSSSCNVGTWLSYSSSSFLRVTRSPMTSSAPSTVITARYTPATGKEIRIWSSYTDINYLPVINLTWYECVWFTTPCISSVAILFFFIICLLIVVVLPYQVDVWVYMHSQNCEVIPNSAWR